MFHKTPAVVWLPLHKTPYLFIHLSCGFILTHKRSCQICYEEKRLGRALTLFCSVLLIGVNIYIYIYKYQCWSVVLKIVSTGSLS